MIKEPSPITIMNPKPQKSPSLWMNMLTLLLLFGMIIGAQNLSQKWLSKVPPPEDQENQIVLEDHENEASLAESRKVELPQGEEKKQEAEKQKDRKTETRKKLRSTYAMPDPYTDSGPMDLDRPENQPPKTLKQAPLKGTPKEATATPPASLDERDQFIPFESD